MATVSPHPISSSIDEESRAQSTFILLLVVVGIFLITIAFVSLSIQWRRLKSARQHRREQRKQEQKTLGNTPKESFSTKQFGVEVRRKHSKEYQELAAQLNDMKQMQSDVKSQLAGLQTLAERISEKKTRSVTNNNNQAYESEIKKQN